MLHRWTPTPQILRRYAEGLPKWDGDMVWIKKNLAKGRKVKGVIMAKSISSNLRHAIVAVPNVSLFEYQVAFTLNQIQEADGPSTGEA